jgi:hypothetical protein
VHLALRDVYYERAVELLSSRRESCVQASCIKVYEEILFLLRIARRHAKFAIREDGKNERDELFCGFMSVLSGNVKAVLSMLNLKSSVEHAEGFFLSSGEANHASVVLQAEEYMRRASDVLRCVRNTLDLARGAYEDLKKSNIDQFSNEERERYEKACRHYRELIRELPEPPKYKKRAGIFD